MVLQNEWITALDLPYAKSPATTCMVEWWGSEGVIGQEGGGGLLEGWWGVGRVCTLWSIILQTVLPNKQISDGTILKSFVIWLSDIPYKVEDE